MFTSEMESFLEGMNLLPWGANSFLLEMTAFAEGEQNLLSHLLPSKCVCGGDEGVYCFHMVCLYVGLPVTFYFCFLVC